MLSQIIIQKGYSWALYVLLIQAYLLHNARACPTVLALMSKHVLAPRTNHCTWAKLFRTLGAELVQHCVVELVVGK